MAEKNITIIRRKKGRGGHAGGHGGAWKVAYADFVTAMMAFFMVMWLMGTDEETKKAIESYFRGEQLFKEYSGANSVFHGGDATEKNEGAQKRFEEKSLDKSDYAPPVYLEEYNILKDLSEYYEGAAFTQDQEGEYVRYAITPRLYFSKGSVQMPDTFESKKLLGLLKTVFNQHDGSVVIEGFSDESQDWSLAYGRAVSVMRWFTQQGIMNNKFIPVAAFSVEKESGRIINLANNDVGSVHFILKRKR